MLLAVLEKRLGEKFRQMDVFVNVAGGVYLSDPSADLAVAAALVSSLRDKHLNSNTVLLGEIGLTGEIRPVSLIEQRISEAEKLGFSTVFLPSQSMKKISRRFDIELQPVDRISLAFSNIFR
jgi:DNA repair protein RadA/Sms